MKIKDQVYLDTQKPLRSFEDFEYERLDNLRKKANYRMERLT